MSFKQKSIDRFWKKIEKTSNCWLWTAYKDKDGYGSITINNYPHKSHRLSYELLNGPFPKHLWVLHKCDNPSCVNPKHLWLGTAKQNNQDREAKGRGADRRGERCPTRKLSWKIVEKIRRSKGLTQRELADKYGVTQSTISHIILNKQWIKRV